jgi:dTDP-glucose 4,6-dehydratase
VVGARERGNESPPRAVSPLLTDIVAWGAAVFAAALRSAGLDVAVPSWTATGLLALTAAALQAGIGLLCNLYRGRYRHGSLDELFAVVLTVGVITALLGTLVAVFGGDWALPRSTALVAGPIALALIGAARIVTRLLVERQRRPSSANARRALIYGAGEAGIGLASRLLAEPDSPYNPVGLIDDSPRKRHLKHGPIEVIGTGAELADAVGRTGAEAVVIAIGRADSALLRRVSDAVDGMAVQIKVLPPLEQILHGGARYWDLRDISIEDLIGRAPIDTDLSSISSYVSGARVLVTGAGGSIGSELAVQLARFGPSQLVLLDRDESGLQQTQIDIDGNGLLTSDGIVLADIRDPAKLQQVFEHARPQVVFHAAALKHLTLLERFPEEAWQTNVLGTLNVLRAARSVGTTTFVNVSTDKAANPTSVLGHSKRAAEKLTAWFAKELDLRYVSVRFGNVIGSRGSMLPTFIRLIAAGGPLTVTHPDATRYFMTIREACQLVIQAGAIARGGEVLILDMGEPVRIQDVARRMIAMSGKDIDIVYTGLRPGEKLHEELVGEGETDDRPFHPLISQASVDPLDPEQLDRTAWMSALGARSPEENAPDRLSGTSVREG